MPNALITLHVTRPGERADALLAAVAQRLHRDALTPDENSAVRLLVDDIDRAGEAWDRVHRALDEAGADWPEYLHLGPRHP